MENRYSNIEVIYQYCLDRSSELRQLSLLGNPWVFLCCASFIDLLNKMTSNSERAGRQDYISFIENYLAKVDERYREFKFQCGEQDLPKQMYYVLRNGIVHSFSVFPDNRGKQEGARSRSILLGHELNGAIHFTSKTDCGYDSVVFTAESFSRDIRCLIEKVFQEEQHHKNILAWCNNNPPISSLTL